MNVLAIDPGNIDSAYVLYDTETPVILDKMKLGNNDLMSWMVEGHVHEIPYEHCAIEMIASYGMPVGKEVFETCLWIGRYIQACNHQKIKHSLIYRKDVKVHLCQSMKAKDGNIRQALIDRFGAPGTKKQPGFTYGVSKDIWAALAVAVTFSEAKP
jgi:hypothetical protein